MHYYDEGRIRSDALVKEVLKKNKENSFWNVFVLLQVNFNIKIFQRWKRLQRKRLMLRVLGRPRRIPVIFLG